MKREDRSDLGISEGLAWLALGAVVGVTAAMLFAPEKGSHTRRRLGGQVRAGRQNLFDSSHEVILKGRELYEKGREIAQEAAEMFERGRRMSEAGFDEQLAAEPVIERGL